MADKTLAFGVASIDRILRELREPEELRHKFALAILAQAKRNAASRPTPQAPMAARVLDVQGASIGTSAGGAPAEVGMGAEFGSNQYLQFQRPSTREGYWLWPASRSTEALGAQDEALEQLLDAAIAGAN